MSLASYYCSTPLSGRIVLRKKIRGKQSYSDSIPIAICAIVVSANTIAAKRKSFHSKNNTARPMEYTRKISESGQTKNEFTAMIEFHIEC